jgi:hypothetical protein
MEIALLYGVFWLLPAVLAGLLAQAKGYDFVPFFLTGLIFSILAAVFIAWALPDRYEERHGAPTSADSVALRSERSWILILTAFGIFALIVIAVALY